MYVNLKPYLKEFLEVKKLILKNRIYNIAKILSYKMRYSFQAHSFNVYYYECNFEIKAISTRFILFLSATWDIFLLLIVFISF